MKELPSLLNDGQTEKKGAHKSRAPILTLTESGMSATANRRRSSTRTRVPLLANICANSFTWKKSSTTSTITTIPVSAKQLRSNQKKRTVDSQGLSKQRRKVEKVSSKVHAVSNMAFLLHGMKSKEQSRSTRRSMKNEVKKKQRKRKRKTKPRARKSLSSAVFAQNDSTRGNKLTWASGKLRGWSK